MSGVQKVRVVAAVALAGLAAWCVGDLAGMTAASAGEAGAKKIVAGKATYRPKGGHEAWKEKGRIIVAMRQCPGCKVEALDAEGKEVVKSASVAAKARGSELQWFSPGAYQVRVTADGYETLVVPGLLVKADNDLWIDVEFE